jgi:hypothetical protein
VRLLSLVLRVRLLSLVLRVRLLSLVLRVRLLSLVLRVRLLSLVLRVRLLSLARSRPPPSLKTPTLWTPPRNPTAASTLNACQTARAGASASRLFATTPPSEKRSQPRC